MQPYRVAGLHENKTSSWAGEGWRKLRPTHNMGDVIQKGGTVQNKSMGKIKLNDIFPAGWHIKQEGYRMEISG